jgi:hypothetical protein
MAITITGSNVCGGGGHIDIAVTGDVAYSFKCAVDDMRGALTDDEKETFLKVLIRYALRGKTKLQARQALQAGIVLDI